MSASPVGRWLARVLVRALAALPFQALVGLANGLAWLAFTLGIRKRVTLENLAQALPEKTPEEREAIARGAYRNMALAALEGMTAQHLSDAQLAERMHLDIPLIEEALRNGTGVFAASAHLGSWELLAVALARRGIPLSAVVRPLKGGFNAEIVQSRLAGGVELILPRGALKGMLKAVGRNRMVAMLLDQSMAADAAVFVPFFGRPASTSPALSMAAIRSGAPSVLIYCLREEGRAVARCAGPFIPPSTGDLRRDIAAHTAAITACIEGLIRKHPDQWLWLHRRWKVAPPEDNAWTSGEPEAAR
jgi:KDO2-lipid IV(A) lauroyltransferase